MFPILFELGRFPVRSYGVMLALAFLAGIALARRDAPRIGVDPDAISDLGVWVILSAIVGSRVFYILFYSWDTVVQDPLEALKLWHGGLVFYGGLVGAVAASAVFLWRRGLPVMTVVDLSAPAIALGQGIGRLGCFLNGCCYGVVCELPVGVTFPSPPPPHPVHPTQLYEAAAQLCWAAVLWRLRTRLPQPGAMISLYVLTYAASRFVIEFVRGDGNPMYGALSLSQWISVVAVVGVGCAWLVYVSRRRAAASVQG